MLRDFHEEVEQTRKSLAEAMQASLPSRQFGTTIMLALVHLTLTQERIRKTVNLEERRTYINEFDTVRRAIQKGIRLLGNAEVSFRGGRGNMPELRQCLPSRMAQGG